MDHVENIYIRYPVQQNGEIRILTLYPSPDFDHDITCGLSVVSTVQPQPYEALSYTWGPPFEGEVLADRQITLCGAALAVTGNLFNALRRLRRQDEPRLLWIDALCIDQSDPAERSSQVDMMAKIYASAKSIVIYVGEDTMLQDGFVAFRVLQHMATLDREAVESIYAIVMGRILDKTTSYPLDLMTRMIPSKLYHELGFGNFEHDPVEFDIHVILMTDMFVDALAKFFSRRYFNRLWVVQELVNVPLGDVLCGPYLMDWTTFRHGFGVLRTADLFLKGQTTDLQQTPLHNATVLEHVLRIRWSSISSLGYSKLLECLQLCREANCQDDRDRVFALSSLGPPGWPRPDYSATLREVWMNFSRVCVQHGCVQLLLHYTSAQLDNDAQKALRDDMSPRLPSWVYDWRHNYEGPLPLQFWEDAESPEGDRHDPIVDEDNRLWCSLGVVGEISGDTSSGTATLGSHGPFGNKAGQMQDTLGLPNWGVSEWAQARHGDVVCRIITKPVMEQHHAVTFVRLRADANQDGAYTLESVNPHTFYSPLVSKDVQLSCTWRRFCIS